MVLNRTNLKKVVPSILVVGALLGATSAQAQTLVAPSTLTTPSTSFSGVTVTGNIGNVTGLPLALPGVGASIPFQVFQSGLIGFGSLPGSGSAVSGSLNIAMSLTVDPGAVVFPLTFSGSTYFFNADANSGFPGFTAGTSVGVTPGGGQSFAFSGSTYQVDIDFASAFTAGAPTSLNISTITGTITNTTAPGVAPEPGTLVLAGLGIAGLAIRRRKH